MEDGLNHDETVIEMLRSALADAECEETGAVSRHARLLETANQQAAQLGLIRIRQHRLREAIAKLSEPPTDG